ncbi:uncharacterized protein SETTUDRAFT_88585 [Exserohilum turcica Et28A]|uniref:Major facilitator superfamily (MFS) profile domain-containing protein n=1 Tax=Exserohilum turcicum (strain 28A) TaxID=671987 RepID=R0K123_EXST2|nr:uncharacterized protein SETTUDRAFT_88585 [Exserohilum turcica Et28A]EOA86843.1 hypothetical protein SETTUDRAFT_88585 [Exserohilum turcica Et28A]
MFDKKTDSKAASDAVPQSESGTTTPDLVADEKAPVKQDADPDVTEEAEIDKEDAAGTAEEEYQTGLPLALVMVSVLLTVCLTSLDMTIVGTAIPKITDEFHGLNMVSWYGSAYFMTFGGFQPASGKFYRYFPIKWSFLGALFIFELGSLICGVAQNSTTFVVGRAIAGLGASAVVTGAMTIAALAAEPAQRPVLMGLASRLTSQNSFYINLPIGGAAAVLIFFSLKMPSTATVEATLKEKFLQMDPVGVSLVMGGIVTFILALEAGGQKHPWDSSMVIGLLVGFVAILVAFVAWEIFNGERSMIPPRLFRERTIWQPAGFIFFYGAGYIVLLYYLPIYFQSIDNRSAINSGVLNLPLVLSLALGSTVSGIVVSKTGLAAPFMVGGAVMATVSTGLLYTFDIGTGVDKWIGYQILYGGSVGLGFQMGINTAQANLKTVDMSSGTGVIFFFQTIGGALSLSAAQSGFANRLINVLARTAPDVNPGAVIGTGATRIRVSFNAQQVPGIIEAYMAGIKVTLALATALTGISALFSLLVQWKRLNLGKLQGGVA